MTFAKLPKPKKCADCGALYDSFNAKYHDPICINTESGMKQFMASRKTQAVVEGLNAIGKSVWYHEYQHGVHTVIDGIDIWFGHANDTWGASVSDNEGHDLGYLETNLVFDTESVARIIYETQRAVDTWLDFN